MGTEHGLAKHSMIQQFSSFQLTIYFEGETQENPLLPSSQWDDVFFFFCCISFVGDERLDLMYSEQSTMQTTKSSPDLFIYFVQGLNERREQTPKGNRSFKDFLRQALVESQYKV